MSSKFFYVGHSISRIYDGSVDNPVIYWTAPSELSYWPHRQYLSRSGCPRQGNSSRTQPMHLGGVVRVGNGYDYVVTHTVHTIKHGESFIRITIHVQVHDCNDFQRVTQVKSRILSTRVCIAPVHSQQVPLHARTEVPVISQRHPQFHPRTKETHLSLLHMFHFNPHSCISTPCFIVWTPCEKFHQHIGRVPLKPHSDGSLIRVLGRWLSLRASVCGRYRTF